MKNVLISLLLFGLLLGMICANFLYINAVAEELFSLYRAIPPEGITERSPDAAEAALFYWEQQRPTVSLSVAEDELDLLSERLAALAAAVKAGDNDSYLNILALLPETIDDIARLERFSAENIF